MNRRFKKIILLDILIVLYFISSSINTVSGLSTTKKLTEVGWNYWHLLTLSEPIAFKKKKKK